MNLLAVFSLLIVFTTFQQPSNTADQTISSIIESATVYLTGAQITRAAEVQLQAGSNVIKFDNLSHFLSEQSIQITTDKPITILSVRKNTTSDTKPNEKLDSLEQEKKKIESDIKLTQAEETVLQRELDILLSNKDLRGENQKISAVEIKQAMEYFREKLSEIEKSRITVNNAIQEAKEKLEEINKQISEIKRMQRLKSGQIIAEIQSSGPQIVNLSFSYFIRNAGWYPSYDVRVDDIEQPLEFTYKANIYQNTGIDWEDIQLSVSSAQPLNSTIIPTIQPIYLRFRQPQAQRRLGDANKLSPQENMDEVAVTGQERERPAAPAVTVSQNQTSFSFNIDQPYSISGNGSPKTVSIQEHSLEATYRYFAAPKARKTAFLTAMLTGWEELNLLNGEMNLYFEQTFVGQSQLRPRAPGDTLQFSLGKDESIVLERNRLKEFTERNFFGNKVRETSAWELVVRNTKNQPIKLTLADQIPVSTNEDIEIDLEERSGATLNKSTGELSWKLRVEDGNTVRKEFRYQIEYPSGKQLEQ